MINNQFFQIQLFKNGFRKNSPQMGFFFIKKYNHNLNNHRHCFPWLLRNETASCGAPQTYKSLLQSIVSQGVEWVKIVGASGPGCNALSAGCLFSWRWRSRLGLQTPARPTLSHSPSPLQRHVLRELWDIWPLSSWTLTAVKLLITTSTINVGLMAKEKTMVDSTKLKEDWTWL